MNASYRWIALAIGACALAAPAQQPKPEDQLKLRKSAYALMNYALGGLTGMVEGKRPYVRDEAIRQADLLAQLSPLPQGLFGEGTDKGETRAKPEIWTHRADFDKKMEAMIHETAKLPAVARGGDTSALKKAVGDVDAACTACHDDYRVKRR